MFSKWQLVRVADERESARERREEEMEEEVTPSAGSTVMLVRMAVPAVALRRGDADDSCSHVYYLQILLIPSMNHNNNNHHHIHLLLRNASSISSYGMLG